MKTRRGFVSNSSSASFVVQKAPLTEFQIEALRNPRACAEGFLRWTPEDHYTDDEWRIEETDDCFSAWTSMDNFDMEQFCTAIGIPAEAMDFFEDSGMLGMIGMLGDIFSDGLDDEDEPEDSVEEE